MEGQKIYFLNSLETKYIYIFGDEKQNSINLRTNQSQWILLDFIIDKKIEIDPIV